MSREWWPEDGVWPSERVADVFRRGEARSEVVRGMHQGAEEPQAAFQARLAIERAGAHPKALWFCVVRE